LDEAGEHFKLESEKILGRAAVIHNFPLLALKKLKKAAEHVWPLGKDSKTSPHFMEGSHFSKDQSQCLKV
jgi:hypothetical protein